MNHHGNNKDKPRNPGIYVVDRGDPLNHPEFLSLFMQAVNISYNNA
jgi:hypothetical protein